MKNLLILIALTATQAMAASTSGKFKLVQTSFYEGVEEVVFLMDSKGDTKVLSEDSYYTLSTNKTSKKLVLKFDDGGDEDSIVGRVTLSLKKKKLKALTTCSAAIDGPNGYIRDGGSTELYKWNKSKKEYQLIEKSGEYSDCFLDIYEEYADYELM